MTGLLAAVVLAVIFVGAVVIVFWDDIKRAFKGR